MLLHIFILAVCIRIMQLTAFNPLTLLVDLWYALIRLQIETGHWLPFVWFNWAQIDYCVIFLRFKWTLGWGISHLLSCKASITALIFGSTSHICRCPRLADFSVQFETHCSAARVQSASFPFQCDSNGTRPFCSWSLGISSSCSWVGGIPTPSNRDTYCIQSGFHNRRSRSHR
jgi:hypothetical protein